jgi:hypothetical protein
MKQNNVPFIIGQIIGSVMDVFWYLLAVIVLALIIL